MKVLSFLIIVVALAACQKPVVRDQASVQREIDSLLRIERAEIARQAAEDLDQKRAIVVRQKVDSILEARKAARRADTLKTQRRQP